MSTYDSTGFSSDRYDTILQNLIDLAEAWKGSSINTDEKKLLGHLLRQMAYQSDQHNQKLQQIYDALSVGNLTGVQLDNVLELIGLYRQSEVKSTATVTCTVDRACTIPKGKIVRTATNLRFVTDEDLEFTASGSQDVTVTCTEYGPNNAGSGEINVISTAVKGWTGVTNAAAAIPGRNRETSAEIKRRHTTAVSSSGERDAASIYQAVTAVDGVSGCYVDETTLPGTLYVYVIGGDEDEVAAAIDSQLTVTIPTDGTTTVSVYDSTIKQSKDIKFTAGSEIDVYVSISISTNPLYPADGDDQIKENLVDLFADLNLGDEVVYFELPNTIYSVGGSTITSLTIGTAPYPSGTVNLPMGFGQRAVLDTDNVVISHV